MRKRSSLSRIANHQKYSYDEGEDYEPIPLQETRDQTVPRQPQSQPQPARSQTTNHSINLGLRPGGEHLLGPGVGWECRPDDGEDGGGRGKEEIGIGEQGVSKPPSGRVNLKKRDTIWYNGIIARVTSRGGKKSGNNYNRFKLELVDYSSQPCNVDLSRA